MNGRTISLEGAMEGAWRLGLSTVIWLCASRPSLHRRTCVPILAAVDRSDPIYRARNGHADLPRPSAIPAQARSDALI
jgi:hypothetical protein